MTGNADLEIFDAHVHFFSPPFFKTLSDQLGPTSSEGDIAGRLGWDVPETVESLAGHSIHLLLCFFGWGFLFGLGFHCLIISPVIFFPNSFLPVGLSQ